VVSSAYSALDDQILACCRQGYPALENLAISGLTQISDGWECDVYSVTVNGIAGGQQTSSDVILRAYPGSEGSITARREYAILEQLRHADYPVPRVDYLGDVDSPLGKPFVLMEKIPGQILGDLINRANEIARDQLLDLYCRRFVDLHALDWQVFARSSAVGDSNGAIQRWLVRARGIFAQFRMTDLDPVIAWLDQRAPDLSPAKLAIVHWDYHPWNVLVRPDGTAVVIDWTAAEVTDYRFDLGWSLLLALASLGQPTRDAILARYEDIAGHPVDDLEFFEVVACARRIFSILTAMRHGAESLGMRAGAEATMKKQIHHLAVAYSLLRERTGLMLPGVEAGIETLRS
jgi:aminoglycoside phosphotransferase (APT) family kinase protein